MHARLFQERECVCERAHLATTSHPGQVTAGLICRLHFTSFITRHGKGSYYLQQVGAVISTCTSTPLHPTHPNPTLSPATSPLFHVPLYSPSFSLSVFVALCRQFHGPTGCLPSITRHQRLLQQCMELCMFVCLPCM